MSYRYYKIGLSQNEFNKGYNLFIKDDNKFSRVLDDVFKEMKIEIYKKNNKMSFANDKKFNYVIVNVEAEKINKESLDLIFSYYLNSVDIKSNNIMSSFLYLIFVVCRTNELNNDLMSFIEKGFNFNKKGQYISYVTIPVVYVENEEILYIGCYNGNELNSKWFGSDMIIWVLEELKKKDVLFNTVGLVKSQNSEKYISNISQYENIYNKNRALKMKKERSVESLFIFIIVLLLFRYICNPVLFILLCLLLILASFSFLKKYRDELYKIDKVKMGISNMDRFGENLNNVLKKYYKNHIGSFTILDEYSKINSDEFLYDNKKNYIILLDDSMEKKIMDIINNIDDRRKKNILVLKKYNDEFLNFVKDDNFLMKKKFLNIIDKIL